MHLNLLHGGQAQGFLQNPRILAKPSEQNTSSGVAGFLSSRPPWLGEFWRRTLRSGSLLGIVYALVSPFFFSIKVPLILLRFSFL